LSPDKVCAKLVPKNLNQEHKSRIKKKGRYLIKRERRVPDFIFISVTSFNKTSLNSTKITKGRYNEDQLTPDAKDSKDVSVPNQDNAFVFVDVKIIMCDPVLACQTVNQKFQIEFLSKLRERIRGKGPQL
jgi:hypothetical protein